MRKKILFIIIVVIIGLGAWSLISTKNDKNEVVLVHEEKFGNYYDEIVNKSKEAFPKEARDFRRFLGDYEDLGDYLRYGENKDILFNFETLGYDEEGIPVVKYNNEYEYNPVTLSQYALCLYGEYLAGDDNVEQLIKVVDKLISLQDSRGAFLYDFPWRYYLNSEDYEAGWVSGMAQGQGLSILSRVYSITGNDKYLQAGIKALDFLTVPTKAGGVMDTLSDLSPDLSENIFFEEYISERPSYTLNGYMFSLLGLYDWSCLDINDNSVKIAKEYFEMGIESLEKTLKYYDIGGFSAYDLSYLVMEERQPHVSANYHGVHIYQLNALHSITGSKTIEKYYELWRSYIE